MIKKIIICFLILTVIYAYDNFYSNSMLIGVYVHRNYKNHFVGELPNVADTLLIKENNIIESPFWGHGTYELGYTVEGTYITLNKKDFSFDTNLNRKMFFGNPKIMICRDLDQYYEKIE